MKSLVWILVRLAAGLALAVTTLWFLVLAPHQAALARIDAHVKSLSSALIALENGQKRIAELPGPATVEPQTKSSKAYVQVLDTAVAVVNVEVPAKPGELTPYWRNEKIEQFNKIVRSPNYATSLNKSAEALKEARDFITHHRAIMHAVANVLEYTPSEDTKSSQPEELLPRLAAAAGGLERTIMRINEAPTYDDPTVKEIIDKVRQIETARKAFEDIVNNARVSGAEKDAYIAKVAEVQRFILANRQAFWEAHHGSVAKAMGAAHKDLMVHGSELRNL
jgi:hypothetical protein